MATDSNYICSLDKISIMKAKEELNENPEDRLAAVQALRDWINEQPHIKCPQIDTLFLLRFLRWAKFSQIRARQKLELYMNFKNSIPKIYANVDSREIEIQKLIDAGYVFLIPNHPKGNPIIVIRQVTLAAFDCPMATYLKTFIILMEYLFTKEINQVSGAILFTDYTGANFTSMTKMMNKDIAIIYREWLKCSTGRIAALYMYRVGTYAEILLPFLKPLMKNKIYKRITVEDTMESMYRHIPKECLPIEYLPDDYTGPSAGTMNDCIKKTKEAILEKDFQENLLYRTGDAFGIHMSKKPEKTVTEHFRKLTVD